MSSLEQRMDTAWVASARSVPIQDVLARHGIKLRGKIEQAGACPKCGGDDRFSINTSKQVFNCRGCGAKGDVIDLVRFLDGTEFVEACTTLVGEPPKANGGNGNGHTPPEVCTAKYDYRDESGALLFQVGRHEQQFAINGGKRKKTFRQKRPDPNRPGQWIYNVDGVRVVPYRLPELVEAIASQHPVLIVEGEAKVDLLHSWNIPATCNAAGAGKWKPEHSEFLQDADVIILPDNDDPGRNHADTVAASLQGIAKSVRVLELPGLGSKGDIVDWAKQGGTVEQLHDLIVREAKPWKLPAKNDDNRGCEQEQQQTSSDNATAAPPKLTFIDMSNWDNEPLPQYDWAVPGLIPLHQTGIFSGDGGIGKSTMGLQLVVAHALGRGWLQFLPEPRPAFFVDAEDSSKVMQIRLWDIRNHYQTSFAEMIEGGLRLLSWTGEDAVLAAPSGKGGKIEPTARYKQLLESMGDIKPIMTVIASTANVFAGNENDRAQVQQFIGLTTRLAIAANGSVLLVNHPSLSGMSSDSGSSGSTQWHNSVRCRFYLKRVTPEKGEQPDDALRELDFKKVQYGKLPERMLLQRRNGLYLQMEGVSNIDRAARQATAKDVFLKLLARFTGANRRVGDKLGANYAPALFAREDEAKAAGLNSKLFEIAMRELFKDERIWNEPYGRPSRPAYYIAVKP
jgi:RecA-family ATPase